MPDSRQHHDENADDGFVDALEAKHEQLMKSDRSRLAGEEFIPDEVASDRVQSAMFVLEMLDEIKHVKRAAENVDTAIGFETGKDSPGQDDDARVIPLADVIPDLKQLGRFQVLEQIGRGGYGIVVRAFDEQLNREVAIKIPRLEAALSADSRRRFVREAKAAASLNHQGIVPVYETGTDQGVDYIVSQFVDGDDLAVYLARGRKFSPTESAKLVSNLADAMEHAHQRGVLHRDLKPSNVILDSGDSSQSRIADFGLAVIADQQSTSLTGAIIGTPAYMSPEQVRGANDQVGPGTDVYGLGAILYELLTGLPPFSGASLVETFKKIVDEDPIPPRQIASTVPRDLESICLKCLEKNPQRRYATARELQADLQRFLDNIPVTARKVTTTDRFVRWVRRNPSMAGLSTALLLALTSGLIIALVLWRTSETHRKTAEQNQTKFQRKAEDLEGIVDRMFSWVSQMPELGLSGMESVRERMLEDVNFYYVNLASETPTDQNLLRKRNESLLKIAQIKSSLADHDGAIAISSGLLDDFSSETPMDFAQQRVDTLMLMAECYWNLQNPEMQQKHFNEAVSLARTIYESESTPSDEDRIEFASSLSEAAEIVYLWGDRTLGNQLALDSIAIWNDIDSEAATDDETTLARCRSFSIAGVSHAASEDRELARQFGQRCIELIENDLSEAVRNSPAAQTMLADACLSLGRSFRVELENAMPYFDKALLTASLLATNHPLIPKYRLQIANIEYQRALTNFVAFLVNKHSPNRLEYLRIASPMFADNVDFLMECRMQFPNDRGSFDGILASNITMKGLVFGELGEHENELESLKFALEFAREIDDQIHSPDSQIRVLGIISNMGLALMKLKRYAEAVEKLEAAGTGLLEVLVDDPENGTAARFASSCFEFLAECFAALDRHQDALDSYRQSMDVFREDNPATMMGLEAAYLVRVDRIDEAQEQFEKFVAHQVAKDTQSKIVTHASRLISAADDLMGVDPPDELVSLRDFVANAAVNTLQTIEESSQMTDEEFQLLLDKPEIGALRATEAYHNWLRDSGRDCND